MAVQLRNSSFSRKPGWTPAACFGLVHILMSSSTELFKCWLMLADLSVVYAAWVGVCRDSCTSWEVHQEKPPTDLVSTVFCHENTHSDIENDEWKAKESTEVFQRGHLIHSWGANGWTLMWGCCWWAPYFVSEWKIRLKIEEIKPQSYQFEGWREALLYAPNMRRLEISMSHYCLLCSWIKTLRQITNVIHV